MLGVIQRLSAELRALGQRTPSAPIWGTVTGVNPLRVEPDTSLDGPLVGDVENAAGPLAVGDRVVLQYHNRKVWVYGPGHRLAQYETGGANGNWLGVGGGTVEPSFRLARQLSTGLSEASLYVPDSPTLNQVAIMNKKDGANMSRLVLDGKGQASINTYADNMTRRLPFAMAAGTVSIVPSGVNVPTTATVTLPAGLFTKQPDSFQVTAISSVPERCHVSVNARSASSFQIVLTRETITSTGIHWTALQLEA